MGALANQFVILKADDGQYYWHLLAGNNRKIAWAGERYQNKSDCVAMVQWIKENARSIPVTDRT